MEKQQELAWKVAQSIEISVDLVSAAKTHLKFLAAVDRNRWLYEGPGLDRAIYRYNTCWLPLLAKHSASLLFEGPLVVPLDCEWIWHCHRLNPIRYKKDCVEFYGRILDCKDVVSSLGGISRSPTEDTWKKLFPGEPYELEFEHVHEDNVSGEKEVGEKWTKYDLISAVQRQTPFFYQVSRLHMKDDRYIEGAVARYKGFLHLIKRNKERGIKSFSVPTYDIDLIWHTHQLHPVSYCKDLVKTMGRILEHDDTDSDRTKGQKLEVGFTGTAKMFEGMYGRRYWRAGALYTGTAPSPVRTTPYSGNNMKKLPATESLKVSLPATEVFEVMLEFPSVRNLPEGHNGNLSVSFSKSQPDMIFKDKKTLPIVSESDEKQVASFQCQPTGNLLFELISTSSDSSHTIGTTSISLEGLLSHDSDLTTEKWLDLVSGSDMEASKPVGLRVAISATIPTAAPHTLHMTRSQSAGVKFPEKWTSVVDEDGNAVLNLQMRNLRKPKGKKGLRKRVVVGIKETGKPRVLAAFVGSKWSMVDSPWSLKRPNENNDDGHILEMTGPHTVRLYPGGRLDYELSQCEKHKTESQHENHLITAVKFSADEPYGTAVASLDMKTGTVKVKEEWFLLPALVVIFTIGSILRKGRRNQTPLKEVDLDAKTNKENALSGGGCVTGCSGGGCGVFGGCGGCGTMAECGGCGGGGCGVVAKSGSCWGTGGGGCTGSGGSGCWGSGFGVAEKSGSCWSTGGSCWGTGGGSGLGVAAKSGSCWGTGGSYWGTGGGSGCRVAAKSGSCWGTGGSCWGTGGESGCGVAAKSGSCWGTGGSCWGTGGGSGCGVAAKSGSCWGTGGSCWGTGGGSGCRVVTKSGSCWGTSGSCWGTGGGCGVSMAKSGGSGVSEGCGVAFGTDEGMKSQSVVGNEIEVA